MDLTLRDRQILIQATGAVVALAAGLSLGGFMRPQLITDRALGPQMVEASAPRAPDAVDDGVSLARYGGKLPDYVLGTDVTRPPVQAALPGPSAGTEPEAREQTADEARAAYAEAAEAAAQPASDRAPDYDAPRTDPAPDADNASNPPPQIVG